VISRPQCTAEADEKGYEKKSYLPSLCQETTA
jgi:hypothetical protein